MKKKLLYFIILIPAFIIIACNPSGLIERNTSGISINTGLVLSTGGSRAVQSDVSSFKITVSADDMETVERIFTEQVINLEIEAGPARKFTLAALDSSSNELFAGSKNVDLTAGDDITISIEMDYSGFYVSFETNGAGTISTLYIEDNGLVPLPAAPSKTGFSLAGWYKDAGFTTPWIFSSDTVTADMTLYAKWTAGDYTITYNLDGGTNNVSNPSSYSIESSTITFAVPTKTGYSFGGWYSDSGLTTPISEVTSGSTGNVEVWAEWNVVTYNITYNLNSGTNGANPATYTVETSTINLADPTRSGWSFTGWYTDSGFTTQITQIPIGSTGDLNLYAKWSITYPGEITTGDATSLGRGAGYYADFWAVNFASTVTVTVDIMGDNGGLGDTYIYLHDTSSVLASNDDGGEGVNARLTYSFTGGVTYYIEATTYSTGVTGTYVIELSTQPNSMAETAAPY